MGKDLDKLLAGAAPDERALVEAWLDGQLGEEDRTEVEAWLLKDPAWKERLPDLARRHRRLGRALDRQAAWPSSLTQASIAPPRVPPRAYERRPAERLQGIFIRRAKANGLFREAKQLASESPDEALRCVYQVFDLSNPISLLGKERLRELMELAARCEEARGDSQAAKQWGSRAQRL